MVSRLLIQALGAASLAMLAHTLSVQSFGSYSFAISFLMFVAMFFEFGLFLPGSRQVAVSDEASGRAVFGGALVVFVPVGVLFLTTVWIVSFGVDEWFNVHAGGALRRVAPLAFVFAFDFVALVFAQGFNRLHVYSTAATLSRLLFAAAIAAVILPGGDLGLTHVLLLEMATVLVGWSLLVAWLKPVWEDLSHRIRDLFVGARSYGFSVYCGRVMSVGTYNMDVLMVAAFTDARSVSFYTLAGAISQCVALPALAMGTALFPVMAVEPTMNRRWLLAAGGIGSLAALTVILLAAPAIRIVFSAKYLPAVPLVLPLALAGVVRGVTTIYNSFLSAHARGRELKNAAFVLTGSNLVLNLLLIPPFGATGAAWASLAALSANLAAHVAFYRRSLSRDPSPVAA